MTPEEAIAKLDAITAENPEYAGLHGRLDVAGAHIDADWLVRMNLTQPHPPKPATTTDQDHYAVAHNPNVCTICGLPILHPIHTLGGTK